VDMRLLIRHRGGLPDRMRRGSIDVQHGAVRGDDAHRSEQPVRGRNLPDRVGGSGLDGRPIRRKGHLDKCHRSARGRRMGKRHTRIGKFTLSGRSLGS